MGCHVSLRDSDDWAASKELWVRVGRDQGSAIWKTANGAPAT